MLLSLINVPAQIWLTPRSTKDLGSNPNFVHLPVPCSGHSTHACPSETSDVVVRINETHSKPSAQGSATLLTRVFITVTTTFVLVSTRTVLVVTSAGLT